MSIRTIYLDGKTSIYAKQGRVWLETEYDGEEAFAIGQALMDAGVVARGPDDWILDDDDAAAGAR